MDLLALPETGLTLSRSPTYHGDKTESKPLQIMQLDLADGVLEDIVNSARHGLKGVNVTFGKTIVCFILNTYSPAPFSEWELIQLQ